MNFEIGGILSVNFAKLTHFFVYLTAITGIGVELGSKTWFTCLLGDPMTGA